MLDSTVPRHLEEAKQKEQNSSCLVIKQNSHFGDTNESKLSFFLAFHHIMLTSSSRSSIKRALLLIVAYSSCNVACSFAANVQVKNRGLDSQWTRNLVGHSAFVPIHRHSDDIYTCTSTPSVMPRQQPSLSAWLGKHRRAIATRLAKVKDTTASLKAQLKKRGVSALASFALLQNVQMAITFTASWAWHATRTRLSPLAAGQWKTFLTVNAGLNTACKVFMPLTLAVSLAMAPALQGLMDWMQRRLRVPKAVAMGTVTILPSLLAMPAIAVPGVALVAVLTGVPALP